MERRRSPLLTVTFKRCSCRPCKPLHFRHRTPKIPRYSNRIDNHRRLTTITPTDRCTNTHRLCILNSAVHTINVKISVVMSTLSIANHFLAEVSGSLVLAIYGNVVTERSIECPYLEMLGGHSYSHHSHSERMTEMTY
jgi:hypothetical protein